jgi:two-component system, cell cycle sensor histidine kinase and response regulator CckA
MSEMLFPHIESEDSKKSAKYKMEKDIGKSRTILVAEDNDSLRILTCRILRNHGYKVLEAGDGNEALRLAKEYEEEIHLILADAVMPGMGGRDAVDQISAFRKEIKAVFTSGYTDTAIIKRGIIDKDTAFLQKPYDAAGLIQKVEDVLDADN